jgi:hypothetical protein
MCELAVAFFAFIRCFQFIRTGIMLRWGISCLRLVPRPHPKVSWPGCTCVRYSGILLHGGFLHRFQPTKNKSHTHCVHLVQQRQTFGSAGTRETATPLSGCNKATQLNLFRPQFDDLIADVWPNIDNCVGPTSRINIEAGRNAELDGKWGQSLGLRDDLAVKGARILKMIPRKMAAA